MATEIETFEHKPEMSDTMYDYFNAFLILNFEMSYLHSTGINVYDNELYIPMYKHTIVQNCLYPCMNCDIHV